MPQPIPKKILKNNPDLAIKPFNTMLVDGSNLLELSFHGDKRLSTDGKPIGGIFQFLLQLKLLLRKGDFRHVYVFWDGDNSGILRYNLLPSYKANRDKNYEVASENESLSEYAKAVEAKIQGMYRHFKKKQDPQKAKEKEIFHWQREIVMECLEELFVRQCLCDKVEADDFVGYYVTHKKKEERIVIVSNDRDLTQLIGEDVIVYMPLLKKFINTKNHTEEIGYHYSNVLVKKMICGDTSDNIKGIKGVGETTLFKNISDFKARTVSLEEVIETCTKINEERVRTKKKPLQWASNIVNRVTEGEQGDKIYEINRKIIDLKHPLMTDEAVEMIEGLMYAPLDPEGRSMENLYKILLKHKIDDLRDDKHFSNFFTEFMNLIDHERKIK